MCSHCFCKRSDGIVDRTGRRVLVLDRMIDGKEIKSREDAHPYKGEIPDELNFERDD